MKFSIHFTQQCSQNIKQIMINLQKCLPRAEVHMAWIAHICLNKNIPDGHRGGGFRDLDIRAGTRGVLGAGEEDSLEYTQPTYQCCYCEQ